MVDVRCLELALPKSQFTREADAFLLKWNNDKVHVCPAALAASLEIKATQGVTPEQHVRKRLRELRFFEGET